MYENYLQYSEQQCRLGDRNTNQTSTDLRRDEIENNCEVTTWSKYGASDDNPITTNDSSMCGFNKDSSAWCIKTKGDDDYQNTYKKIAALEFEKFDCHINSKFES